MTSENIPSIAEVYHAWRAKSARPAYADQQGFHKSVSLEEIRGHDYVLTPGRYVGTEEAEDDGELFEDRMKRLTGILHNQLAESASLEKTIRANLSVLGFPV